MPKDLTLALPQLDFRPVNLVPLLSAFQSEGVAHRVPVQILTARVGLGNNLLFVSQQDAGNAHDENHQPGDDAYRQMTPKDYFA